MKRLIGVIAVVILAGCGVSGSPAPSPQGGGQSPAAAPGSSALPPAGSAVQGFMLCPSGDAGTACPLPAGGYQAGEHDAVALTIGEPGWQEEPAQEQPTLVLSRVDAPDQRVTIDLGDTGPLLSDTDLAAMLTQTFGYKIGDPSPTTIGGATGFAIELAPTEATTISIPGSGSYELQPDHWYRLAVLQYPMLQESVVEVVLIEAPTADSETFPSVADALLQSAQFSSGN